MCLDGLAADRLDKAAGHLWQLRVHVSKYISFAHADLVIFMLSILNVAVQRIPDVSPVSAGHLYMGSAIT